MLARVNHRAPSESRPRSIHHQYGSAAVRLGDAAERCRICYQLCLHFVKIRLRVTDEVAIVPIGCTAERRSAAEAEEARTQRCTHVDQRHDARLSRRGAPAASQEKLDAVQQAGRVLPRPPAEHEPLGQAPAQEPRAAVHLLRIGCQRQREAGADDGRDGHGHRGADCESSRWRK